MSTDSCAILLDARRRGVKEEAAVASLPEAHLLSEETRASRAAQSLPQFRR
jgi:hypothetical protein